MTMRFFLFFGLLFSFAKISAQAVHRKGVAPIDKSKPADSTKAADYTVSQLKGKWQEYKRTDYHGNAIDFGDSLLLNFTGDDKVETKTSVSNSMSMVGIASIDGDNNLTVASDAYTIKAFGKNEMVLDDNDQYLHQFKKVDEFWYEMIENKPAAAAAQDTAVKVAIQNTLGNWSIYKRQAKPGAITNNMELIKYLNIKTKTTDSTAVGNITIYEGETSQQLPCTVSISGSTIKIIAGQNKWQLSVFQADANNFIFGNSGLMYFCKKENN